MRRRRIILDDEDEDPLSGVANLFDVAMVFAVALLVMLVVSYNVPELIDDESDLTVVKNPGQPNMQIIIKEGKTLKVLNMTEELAGGQGSRMGTAYRLENGEIIYVPDEGSEDK
jgi:hypothetical protein